MCLAASTTRCSKRLVAGKGGVFPAAHQAISLVTFFLNALIAMTNADTMLIVGWSPLPTTVVFDVMREFSARGRKGHAQHEDI